jgi:hypothetical protein
MIDLHLTAEQEALAQRIAALLVKNFQQEALNMARILASKPDHELLGAAEFHIRDHAHQMGAHALQTALNERKKGGTKGPA